MRNTVVCVLALALGVELALGRNLFRRNGGKRQGTGDILDLGENVDLREIIISYIKDQIKNEWEEIGNKCHPGFKPDCSSISDDVNALLEEDNKEEINNLMVNIDITLLSLDLSTDDSQCTFKLCTYRAVQKKHAAGQSIQSCQADSCDSVKRSLRRGLTPAIRDIHIQVPSEVDRFLFSLCAATIAFDECRWFDDVCAEIIAEQMYDKMEMCSEDSDSTESQKKSLKRLMAISYDDSLNNHPEDPHSSSPEDSPGNNHGHSLGNSQDLPFENLNDLLFKKEAGETLKRALKRLGI